MTFQRTFGEIDFSREFGGKGGAVILAYGSRESLWWGSDGKAPGGSKDLVL